MNRKAHRTLRILMIPLMISVGTAIASDYTVDWYTIDGGGEMFSTGGGFELGGTIGQPDTSVMTGGEFELTGGFWPGACFLVGDVDGDGDVDLGDLAALLAAYGCCVGDPCYNPDADLDGDGCVDLPDLAALLANYGMSC